MYVCICNAVTDAEIRKAADAGVTNLWQLQSELGVATNCGSCKEVAAEILGQVQGKNRRPRRVEPKLFVPSIA